MYYLWNIFVICAVVDVDVYNWNTWIKESGLIHEH